MSPTRFASEHRWIYIGAIVLLVALAVIGIINYESVKKTNQATEKANRLADAAVEAGYPRPDTDTIVRALGTDGGIVCENPGSALKSALWKINVSNGAAFVGARPVIGDGAALRAEAKILEIYCPDRLDSFQDRLNDLKTDDTVRR
ncbi:hypothetical protein ACK389_21140 [Streptomyces antibioticus]|uniref:hypothetical protein n=1 Tax=Streptomyces antibioticus TaxID=1890 RepID=UPI00225C392C|nr:hypothetical protein [Streptomyces antibioticus]MCX4737869.1 hypothetical protein [Streptomyces antibioticus]MCX5170339.1 hypothetical protein [Streptomyces antibioticus]